MESIFKTTKIEHLAGIIPIASPPLKDFKYPWHDCMMPVGPDFLAIERAIYACAAAGCETIWVVAHIGLSGVLKNRVKEYITDPVSLHNKVQFGEKRDIPIFYVPIHPKDKKKRDSLGWSVLYGAQVAHKTSSFISKWTAPEKFLAVFPYGILDETFIKTGDIRLQISNTESPIMFTHNNKTIKDNLHLPFTFTVEDYKKCVKDIRQKFINKWGEGKTVRNFELKEIFDALDTEKYSMIELPWFHDISTWDGYSEFLKSDNVISKPNQLFRSERRRKFKNEKIE